MDNKEIVETLNTLVETSRDGDKGFSACAADAKDASLKAYFTICATRCRTSVNAMESKVRELGGVAETSGTVAAGVQRAWLGLRTSITSNDDLVVLEECERAEDVAKAAYSAALAKDLPATVRELVQQQYDGVKANHNHVRGLRDARKLATAGT